MAVSLAIAVLECARACWTSQKSWRKWTSLYLNLQIHLSQKIRNETNREPQISENGELQRRAWDNAANPRMPPSVSPRYNECYRFRVYRA